MNKNNSVARGWFEFVLFGVLLLIFAEGIALPSTLGGGPHRFDLAIISAAAVGAIWVLMAVVLFINSVDIVSQHRPTDADGDVDFSYNAAFPNSTFGRSLNALFAGRKIR